VLQRLHGRLGLGQPDALAAGLDMYVPLRYGLRSPPLARAEPRLDLDALLHALLHGTPRDMARVGGGDPDTSSTRECRCIFAQGAAGTGKTLLGWRLAQMYDQLPRGRQASARIPIVIALPTVADAVRAAVQAAAREVDAFLVTQVLQAYDSRALDAAWQAMDAAQRAWLHETGFVFVLDGVDELVARLAIHTLLRLRAWPNSVFVVAARTGFFADDNDGLQHVCPRDGEGGLLAAQMRAIHLLPFDATQVEMYIDGFARRHGDVHEGWDGPRYRDALQAFPQLDELATEPLLLFMVLNVLPLVQGGGGRVRLDPVTLEVNDNVTDSDAVFPRVTRAELYALFTHAWVQREARKVNMDTAAFRRDAVRFAEALAFRMFETDTAQLAFAAEDDLAVLAAAKPAPELSLQHRSAHTAVARADPVLMEMLGMTPPATRTVASFVMSKALGFLSVLIATLTGNTTLRDAGNASSDAKRLQLTG
jgi:hypothetical protein